MASLKDKTAKSLVWKLLERFSVQGVSFIISLVLARLLGPSVYGELTIITVFTTFANVFVQTGLNTALIQNKSVTKKDYSTVLYASLTMATVLYVILFFLAPFAAKFFELPKITIMMRTVAVILFFNAFNSVQIAKVSREMRFHVLFISNACTVIVSGTCGIVLAFSGAGTWALIVQQIVSSVVSCTVMFFTVKWRPELFFSMKRFRELFSFGSKLLLSQLIKTSSQEIRSVLIGKKYTTAMLAQYNRGLQFPQLITSNVDGALNSVLLPAYATAQDDLPRLKSMMRRSVVTSTFLIFPAMAGLAAVGEPLIMLVLGEAWLPCLPFLRIFCITCSVYPIHTANLQAMNAIGRSDMFLKLEIIKFVMTLGTLSITVFCFDSVIAIAIGSLIITPIAAILNAFPNRKLLGYKIEEQIKDVLPSLLLSLTMAAAVSAVMLLKLNDFVTLIIQLFVGVTIYFGLARLFKMECFMYLLKTAAEYMKKLGITAKLAKIMKKDGNKND